MVTFSIENSSLFIKNLLPILQTLNTNVIERCGKVRCWGLSFSDLTPNYFVQYDLL